MITPEDMTLMERFIDGEVSPAEKALYEKRLREEPAFLAAHLEQVQMHAMFLFSRRVAAHTQGRASRRRFPFLKVAAALVLLAGVGLAAAHYYKARALEGVAEVGNIGSVAPAGIGARLGTDERAASGQSSRTVASARAAAQKKGGASVPRQRFVGGPDARRKGGEGNQMNTQMKKAIQAAASLAALAVASNAPAALADGGAAYDSPVFAVNADPDGSVFWRTAATPGAEAVTLDWPEGAVSATLLFESGVDSKTLTITDTAQKEVAVPAPRELRFERVYALTLTYSDSAGAALLTRTATVGFVSSVAVDDAAFKVVTPSEDGAMPTAWYRGSKYNVLPVEAGMSALTFDGEGFATDGLPGWYGWGPVALGDHTIGTNGVTVLSVTRMPSGTLSVIH